MAQAKTAGKKKQVQKVRVIDGKVVKPCLYNGKAIGHGQYLAAMVGDQLVLDQNGKPFGYRDGDLVDPATLTA